MSRRDRQGAGVPSPDPGTDGEFADRLAEVSDRLEAGHSVDIDAMTRDHPGRAQELRRLLPTLAMLADLTPASRRQFLPAGAADLGAAEVDDMRFDDFRVLRELGRGGMGIVYEAEQISIVRRVALKVLPTAATVDPRQVLRFQLEAQIAGSLHHPHIVPVFAVGSVGRVPFFAMQLIEGDSLSALIQDVRGRSRRGREVPTGSTATKGGSPATGVETEAENETEAFFRTAAELGSQAADALEHAHRNGVIHRDVKPSNLLIDRGGRLWVADFGMARVQGDPGLTSTGDLVGTLRYMSPEQCRAGEEVVDHRTDIYSLGATLYELITLCPAFAGNDRPLLLTRISREGPKPLRSINARTPPDLETVVLKAMARETADRYPTAQDLAKDLRRYLRGEPVLARPASRLSLVGRWARQRPAEAGLAAGCLAAVLAGALGAAWHESQLRRANGELRASLRANRQYARQIQTEQARSTREAWLSGRHLFDNHISEAQRFHREGSTERALQLLYDQIPKEGGRDGRDFTWRYLWRRENRDVSLVWNLQGDSQALIVYADDSRPTDAVPGWRAVTLIRNRSVLGWGDRSTDVAPRPLARASRIAVSPDGRWLASVPEYGAPGRPATVEVRGLVTDPPVDTLEVGGLPVADLKFMSDTRLALALGPSGGSRTVKLIDPEAGKDLWSTTERGADPICLAAAARVPVLAWGVEGPGASITVADFRGKATPNLKRLEVRGPHRPVCIKISADGQVLATTGRDGSLRVWDLADGGVREIARGLFSKGACPVTLSDDGRRVAARGEGSAEVRVWDAATGGLIASRMFPTYNIHDLAFGPGGHDLVVDTEDPRVRVWHLDPPAEPPQIEGHDDEVWSAAFTPDGTTLATGSNDETARLWDVATGRELAVLSGHVATVSSVAFTPDGLRLLTGGLDGRVKAWDRAGVNLATLGEDGRQVRAVAVAPDGKTFATADSDRSVRLYGVSDFGQIMTLRGHESMVRCVAYSPDGAKIASGGNDHRVVLWDAGSGRVDRSFGDPHPVQAVAFSPDGRTLVSGDELGNITLRGLDDGTSTVIRAHGGRGVLSLAYSSDGLTLASGGADAAVLLWDPVTGRELLRLDDKHRERVNSVAFDRKGRTLVTASHEGVVRLWFAGG